RHWYFYIEASDRVTLEPCSLVSTTPSGPLARSAATFTWLTPIRTRPRAAHPCRKSDSPLPLVISIL
ncbi:MAG: hypothetical protein ACE5IQ_11700, partial [Candidatus Methylomirabilales bacterium]